MAGPVTYFSWWRSIGVMMAVDNNILDLLYSYYVLLTTKYPMQVAQVGY